MTVSSHCVPACVTLNLSKILQPAWSTQPVAVQPGLYGETIKVIESQRHLNTRSSWRVNPAELLKPRPAVHLWGRCADYSGCTKYKLTIACPEPREYAHVWKHWSLPGMVLQHTFYPSTWDQRRAPTLPSSGHVLKKLKDSFPSHSESPT